MIYSYSQNIIIFLLIIMIFGACAGKKDNSEQPVAKLKKEQVVVELQETHDSHPGKVLYTTHCLPCHQANGQGVPGMYPSIVDTKWVNGDNEALISIVLHGMDEEISVNGETFNTIMAPLPHLNDQEVSDVLNYIRLRFGSSKEKVEPEQVKKVRNMVP